MQTEDILFRFHSNIFDEEMIETLSCEVLDIDNGIYRLDNVPFYARLRLKVQNNQNKFWYQGGYRIYYGFDDLDPELTTKVKSVLN